MRWEICFNLSVLRMLSFALDLHWRRQQAAAAAAAAASPARSPASAKQPKPQQGPAQAEQEPEQHVGTGKAPGSGAAAAALWRQQTPLPSDADYGPASFLAYVLYTPLYLAGPIITYQDFAWQLRQRTVPSAAAVSDVLLRVSRCCCLACSMICIRLPSCAAC